MPRPSCARTRSLPPSLLLSLLPSLPPFLPPSLPFFLLPSMLAFRPASLAPFFPCSIPLTRTSDLLNRSQFCYLSHPQSKPTFPSLAHTRTHTHTHTQTLTHTQTVRLFRKLSSLRVLFNALLKSIIPVISSLIIMFMITAMYAFRSLSLSLSV